MRKLVVLSFAMAVLAILYSTAEAATVQSMSTVGSTTKKITTPKGSTTKKQSTTTPRTTRMSTTKPSTTKPSTTKPTKPTTKPSTTKPTKPTTKSSTTKPTTKPSTTKPTTKRSTPSGSTTTTYYSNVCNMNSLTTCMSYINPGYTARVNAWQQGIHFNAQYSSKADIGTSVLYEDDSTFTFQFDPNVHNYIGDCSVTIKIYDTIDPNTHLPRYTYTCKSKLPTKPIKVDSSEVRVLLTNNLKSNAFDFSILVTLHDTNHPVNITWYIAGPTIGFIIALMVLLVVIRHFRRRRLGYRSF